MDTPDTRTDFGIRKTVFSPGRAPTQLDLSVRANRHLVMLRRGYGPRHVVTDALSPREALHLGRVLIEEGRRAEASEASA